MHLCRIVAVAALTILCRNSHGDLAPASSATAPYTFSVVFSAECNSLFDWHSVALYYSFETSGFSKTANITRLLARSEQEQKHYPSIMHNLGPTFMHRNLRDDPLVDEKGYPSYNKVRCLHLPKVAPQDLFTLSGVRARLLSPTR